MQCSNLSEIIPEKLKSVYLKLQDETSRRIFLDRLSYFITGDIVHLKNMLRAINRFPDKRMKTIEDLFDDKSVKLREIIIYGAGRKAEYSLNMLNTQQLKVVGYCDRDKAKQGRLCNGIPVISPEELIREHRDKIVFVDSTVHCAGICEDLKKLGFPFDQVYLSTAFNDNYFWEDFMVREGHEIYIDAGCFDGYTIENFIKFCDGKYKKIYGMEPNPVCYELTKKCILDNGLRNVTLVNKGAWSNEMTLSFNPHETPSSASISAEGSIYVDVTTIDNLVNNGTGGASITNKDGH